MAKYRPFATDAGTFGGRLMHNLEGTGITEPLFDDYSAAEHRYLERRQWETANELQAEANRKLESIDSQLQQLNYQASETNQMMRASLESQRQQLELQIQEAKNAAAQRVKEDYRSFADWRQTPDGQRFVEWCNKAGAILMTVASYDARFTAVHEGLLDEAITDADRAAVESGEWIPHSDEYKRGVALQRVGAIGAIISFFSIFLVPKISPLLFFGCIGLFIYGSRMKKKETGWEERNHQAMLAAKERRLAILGYDPLSGDEGPSLFAPATLEYLASWSVAADRGFEYHTHPDSLPRLGFPPFAPRDGIRAPKLLAEYDTYVAELNGA